MMRFNLDDPKVWDQWRDLYDDLTSEEQLQFLNDCEERFPTQQHFTAAIFHNVFKEEDLKQQGQGPRVFEIGGWKGELAALMIKDHFISRWTNMECCFSAIKKTVELNRSIYDPIPAERFRWFYSWRDAAYEVCVSSNTIEHLSDDDMKELINYISGIPLVVFEAPIKESGDDWRGYVGTHKLLMGWSGVDKLMRARGYDVQVLTDQCHRYNFKTGV